MTNQPTASGVSEEMLTAAMDEARITGSVSMVPRARMLRILEAALSAMDFQSRVQPWMMACFGPEISADKLEWNDRFIEEALELCQASGYTKDRAHALVDYVFDRPQGEINQEVGGVMVTLAAHCLAHGVDMHQAGETELARIWTKVDKIRAKQSAKPTGSALPIAAAPPQPIPTPDEALREVLEKASASIAHMVDEYTQRGWNDLGGADFAKIVHRRLSRFINETALSRARPKAKRFHNEDCELRGDGPCPCDQTQGKDYP